jgi:hypothetical protein
MLKSERNYNIMSSIPQISSRGTTYAKPLDKLHNDPRIGNVYNTDTNPSGVINLGSAVNVSLVLGL